MTWSTRSSRFRVVALLSALVILCLASAAQAQNSYQLFSSVNVNNSPANASATNPNITGSTILNLSCPLEGLSAVLTSSPTKTGDTFANVFEDNFITLLASPNQNPEGSGSNICQGGFNDVGDTGGTDCFVDAYTSAFQNFIGQNPDTAANGTFISQFGVPAIDISQELASALGENGNVSASFQLVDRGGVYGSSSLYLVTNCTNAGVSSGSVTGNPLSENSATTTATFNNTPNNVVQLTSDYSATAGTITDGTVPHTLDLAIQSPIPPTADATVWPGFVKGTSHALSQCIPHTGEIDSQNNAACKLYTVVCTNPNDGTTSGGNCPVSTLRNEILQDIFDNAPIASLPDVPGFAPGPTGSVPVNFHTGFGFLMASDTWTGGACNFEVNPGLTNAQPDLCPENFLTFYKGPGLTVAQATIQRPNSTLIVVADDPMPLSTLTWGANPAGWNNTSTVHVSFSTQPPYFGTSPTNDDRSVPIYSLTYQLTSSQNVPPDTSSPLNGTTVTNPAQCPNTWPAVPSAPPQPWTNSANFAPGDGNWVLNYQTMDCGGTEELKFTNHGGSTGWLSTYYSVNINIDTVKPTISAPVLSPAPSNNNSVPNSYLLNQVVTASYTCTDDRSGIATCGLSAGNNGLTQSVVSTLDTTTAGPHTVTLPVVDVAGNSGTSATITYTVVDQAADLAAAKLAPSSVKSGTKMTYGIISTNFGPNTANGVTITDTLPVGVSAQSAVFAVVSCSGGTCNIPSQGTACAIVSNPSTGDVVTCNVGTEPSISKTLNAVGVAIQVNVNAPSGSVLKNTAKVTSLNRDPKPGNNTSNTVTTKVK